MSMTKIEISPIKQVIVGSATRWGTWPMFFYRNLDIGESPDLAEYQMNYILSTTCTDLRKVAPYTITLGIDDVPVSFEIDTGSAVTVVGKRALADISPKQPCSSIFKTITGQPMSILGRRQVKVEYEGQIYILSIHADEHASTSLLGRDWIKNLPGILPSINSLSSNC